MRKMFNIQQLTCRELGSYIMLSEENARNLGFKGKFYHKIESPSFIRPNTLWHKDKIAQTLQIEPKKHHDFSFFKIGKTFGFETKRFIELQEGILLYYQDGKDKQCKGFCNLSNVYLYYFKLNDNYLLYLTNGNQYSQFFFPDNSFYHTVSPKLLKSVIQLNFNQKYAIEKLIGKGSFSKVYQGRNKQTGERKAIKIVPKKDKNGLQTKNIVEEEKKIMNILNSQYTCQLIEFYEEDDVFIFILQFLQGEDLMHFIKNNSEMTIRQAVLLLKNILECLHYCHQLRVMHRDLKPQNIIIDDKNKQPKLIDFGLSLHIGEGGVDPKKFKRCGTMGYMAYEVIQNTAQKRKAYDFKCDIFSYGIIAHMLLLGYNPLKGKNYEETHAKNRECNIQLDKAAIQQKFGQRCYELLSKLLQKEPKKRITAQEGLSYPFFQEQNIKKMEQIAENFLKKESKKQESVKTIEDGSNDENMYNLHENELQIKIPRVNSMSRRPSHFAFNQD